MKYFLQLLFIAIVAISCNNNNEKTNGTNASAPVPPIADSISKSVDSIINQLAISHKCRITMKIVNDSGGFHYSGFDGRENKPITDFSGTIDIGSCTKMFTVASIMQLMEQNKLSLQDKLTAVLPNDTLYKNLLVFNGKDYIDSVRIVNLLNHSSGFPEYFIDGDESKELELHGDSSLRFTPYGLIEMAKKTNKPQFVPGTKFKYCNVNYILLGLIIEKLSGKTYQQYIQENIIDPLGLKHTYFGSVNPPANRTAGHFKGNISVMPATIAWAAGEIISDLDDMQTFIREWNKGKLFSNPSTIASLKKDNYQDMLAGVIQYGMGCIKISDQSFGHGGETFGFQTYMGVLKNNYSFVFGIDDASVSAWEPAMNLTTLFSSLK